MASPPQPQPMSSSVSKEQLALAQERVRGLPVELLLQDYRDLQGSFDKVVSVGMFEHRCV